MKAVQLIIRIAIAIFLGWPLTFAPVLFTEPLGLHGWGYAHLGLPLLIYPFAAWFVYVLLGLLPIYKKPAQSDD
jgi:hypothetical protein